MDKMSVKRALMVLDRWHCEPVADVWKARDIVAAHIAQLEARLNRAGWKWVPVEPTEEMIEAGRGAVMARDCSAANWSPAQHYEASGQSTEGIPPYVLEGYHSIIPKAQGAALVWYSMLTAAPAPGDDGEGK